MSSNENEELTTHLIWVTGMRNVGKRTFVDAITQGKLTQNGIPVVTHEDHTLWFFIDELTGKGIDSSTITIYMYDVCNERSFKAIKDKFSNFSRSNWSNYLIGNKIDKQLNHRQVDYEDAKNFGIDAGMMFTEISAVKQSNLGIVEKFLNNKVKQITRGFNSKPPELPPRDDDLSQIDSSIYKDSAVVSDLEKRLVEKMYLGNMNSYDISTSNKIDSSRHMETGNFGASSQAQNLSYINDSYSVSPHQIDPTFTLSSKNQLPHSKSSKNFDNYQHSSYANSNIAKNEDTEELHRQSQIMTVNDIGQTSRVQSSPKSHYHSFLRKFQINSGMNDETTENDTSYNMRQVSSYSNLIEKKMEHNLSFSNNALGDDETHELTLKNLDDLDIDYDKYSKQDMFNETEPVVIVEDRVRQLPNPMVSKMPQRSHTVIETNNKEHEKLDEEMKQLEESIKRIDDQNKALKIQSSSK